MSTAFATVSSMIDAPLHSEFPFLANVSSLQARRDMRPSASSQISLVLEKQRSSDRRVQIEAALREARGKVYGPCGAAARLGLPSTTLDSQIRALSINKHQFQMISTARESRGSTRFREITRVFSCLSTEVQRLFAGTSVALHD